MAPAGGVTALPCGICAQPIERNASCQLAHQDHCHSCWDLSLRGALEASTHRAPAGSLVLSPRDVAALGQYLVHLRRVQEGER